MKHEEKGEARKRSPHQQVSLVALALSHNRFASGVGPTLHISTHICSQMERGRMNRQWFHIQSRSMSARAEAPWSSAVREDINHEGDRGARGQQQAGKTDPACVDLNAAADQDHVRLDRCHDGLQRRPRRHRV